jgi:uncharacterized protein (TIGR03435 family)
MGGSFFASDKTIHDLADDLWERLSVPVTDACGLSSQYDFTLTYLPDDQLVPTSPRSAQYPPAPKIIKAVESQLGLPLEKGKVAAL